MKGRVGVALIALIALAAFSASAATAGSKGANPLSYYQTHGLRVGYDGEVPWDYIQKGKFLGSDVSIATQCAHQLGINKVIPEQVDWNGLLPGLQANRWDVIAAGMSLEKQRLQVAIATQQMYGFGVKILVKKGNPLGIHSFKDAASKHVTVSMINGANYQTQLQSLGVKLKLYPTLSAEIADLEAGRIDIVSNAELSLVDYVKTHPKAGVEVAAPWNGNGVGASFPALYFNKGQTVLRDAMNKCITGLKKSGWLAKTLKHYGFDPSTITPASYGEPNCAMKSDQWCPSR